MCPHLCNLEESRNTRRPGLCFLLIVRGGRVRLMSRSCELPQAKRWHFAMLTMGMRKENGRWLVAHEHHSYPISSDES